MRHNRDGRKLGRTASHRKAMLGNMVTSLFLRERIRTTTPKAKEARRLAERIITFARRGTLADRRHVAKTVHDHAVLRKLFDEIGPRFKERPGGYTRILRTGVRKGDAADTAILELLGENDQGRKKTASRKTYRKIDVPESPTIKAKAAAKKAAEEAAAAKAAEEAAEAEAKAAEAAAAEAEAGEETPEAGEAAGEAPADGKKE
ncbi:MAG: 50S ribosomal protein L17 [Candidatus Krumholzibacteriota bacterium]|nr:50S ribosomal protein L17 [Candidatus Krumholzibacteriota bacterium]